VKAYYALERFRTGSAFKPWLMRIVVNEALNRFPGGA
jgi:DNA-directed RNA polymerase specialized sigma24 family protein